MSVYLIKMFGISLLLTIVVEGIVAVIFGVRRARSFILVLLVNILTNPAAVLVNWLLGVFVPGYGGLAWQIPIEVIVVVIEAIIYYNFSKDEEIDIKKPVLLAVCANLVSWLLAAAYMLIR